MQSVAPWLWSAVYSSFLMNTPVPIPRTHLQYSTVLQSETVCLFHPFTVFLLRFSRKPVKESLCYDLNECIWRLFLVVVNAVKTIWLRAIREVEYGYRPEIVAILSSFVSCVYPSFAMALMGMMA